MHKLPCVAAAPARTRLSSRAPSAALNLAVVFAIVLGLGASVGEDDGSGLGSDTGSGVGDGVLVGGGESVGGGVLAGGDELAGGGVLAGGLVGGGAELVADAGGRLKDGAGDVAGVGLARFVAVLPGWDVTFSGSHCSLLPATAAIVRACAAPGAPSEPG